MVDSNYAVFRDVVWNCDRCCIYPSIRYWRALNSWVCYLQGFVTAWGLDAKPVLGFNVCHVPEKVLSASSQSI